MDLLSWFAGRSWPTCIWFAGRLCANINPSYGPPGMPALRALLGRAGAAREGLVTYTRLDAASQDAWAAMRSSPAQEECPGSSAAAVPVSGPVSRLGSDPAALRGSSLAAYDPAGSRLTSQLVEARGTASAWQLEARAQADSLISRGAETVGPAGKAAAVEQGAVGGAALPCSSGSEPGNPEGAVSDAQQDAGRPAAPPSSPGAEPGSAADRAGDADQGAAGPDASPGSPGADPGSLGEGAGAVQQGAAQRTGHLSGLNPGARSPRGPAHVAPAAASAGPRSTERACGKRHARAADGMDRGKGTTGVVDSTLTAAADHEAAPAAKRQRAAHAQDPAGASAECAPIPAGCAAAAEGAAEGRPAHATALPRSSSGGAALGAAGGSGSNGQKCSPRTCEDAVVKITLNAGPQGLSHGTKAPGGGGIVAAAGMPAPCRVGASAGAIARVHANTAFESVPDSVEGEGGGSPAVAGGGEQSGDPGARAAEADQEADCPAKGSPTPAEGAAAGSRPAACRAAASRGQQAPSAEGAQAGGERAAVLGSAPQPAADADREAACAPGGHAPPQPKACAPAAGAAAACVGKARSTAPAPGGRAPPSDAEVRELELAASQLHASPNPNPDPKAGSLDATAQPSLAPRGHAAPGAAACGGGARARACLGVGSGLGSGVADALPVGAALQAVLAGLPQLAPSTAWADREVSHCSVLAPMVSRHHSILLLAILAFDLSMGMHAVLASPCCSIGSKDVPMLSGLTGSCAKPHLPCSCTCIMLMRMSTTFECIPGCAG